MSIRVGRGYLFPYVLKLHCTISQIFILCQCCISFFFEFSVSFMGWWFCYISFFSFSKVYNVWPGLIFGFNDEFLRVKFFNTQLWHKFSFFNMKLYCFFSFILELFTTQTKNALSFGGSDVSIISAYSL